MDWNRIERRWYQLKGKLKEPWGHLTNDDHLVLKPVRSRNRPQDAALLGMINSDVGTKCCSRN